MFGLCLQRTIEHLPQCPVVRELFIRNGCSCAHIVEFLGIDKASFPINFALKAKLLHITHHTFNTLRHNPGLDVQQLILAYVNRTYPSLR